MNEFNENQSGSGNGLISLILLVIIALLAYQIYRMESIFKLLTQDGIEVAAPTGVTGGSDKKNEAPALGDNKASKPEKALATGAQQPKTVGSETPVQKKPSTTVKHSSPQRLSKDKIKVSVKAKVENRYISYKPDIPIKKDGITGVVVIDIVVKSYGGVTKVSLNPASTIKDEDIIDSCKECALKTDFSYNIDCPDRQTGTITYTFTERVIE